MVRRCTKGYDCTSIAKERLKHIVSKEAFNIDGLGKKVIDQFWNLNFIKTPSDIFELDFNKIKKLEGWGDLSAENLKLAINKAKNISLNRFIYSIGIRHIGQESAKILASFFKSGEQFSNILQKTNRDEILQNLNDLDGIGETQIFSLKNFFHKDKNVKIEKLITKLNIQDFKETNVKGKLRNTNVMFTGGFEKISRSEAKLLQKIWVERFSICFKEVKHFIGNSKPTKKKIEKAKEFKIFSEDEWYKLLNI